jgi:hypothetical protein
VNAISMRSRGGGAGSIEALRLRAAMCVMLFEMVCCKKRNFFLGT